VEATSGEREDAPGLEEDSLIPLDELVRDGGAGVLDLLAAVLGEGVEDNGAIVKQAVFAMLPGYDAGDAMWVGSVGGEAVLSLLKKAVSGE